MYQRNIAIKSRPKAAILRIKKQKKKRLKAQVTTTPVITLAWNLSKTWFTITDLTSYQNRKKSPVQEFRQ